MCFHVTCSHTREIQQAHTAVRKTCPVKGMNISDIFLYKYKIYTYFTRWFYKLLMLDFFGLFFIPNEEGFRVCLGFQSTSNHSLITSDPWENTNLLFVFASLFNWEKIDQQLWTSRFKATSDVKSALHKSAELAEMTNEHLRKCGTIFTSGATMGHLPHQAAWHHLD